MLRIAAATLVMFCNISSAETIAEAGLTQVSGEWNTGWMFQVTERVKDRYDFTFGYVSEQDFKLCDRPDCEWGADEALFVSASLAAPLGNDRLRLRIGPAWFSDISRISTSKFRAMVGLEYRYDRFMFSVIHFSNGGSGGEREVCNRMYCFTDQYNLGLDSLFRLGVVF